jgi:hypothetical protein
VQCYSIDNRHCDFGILFCLDVFSASDDSDDDRMSVTSEPVIGTMAQRVRSRGYRSDAASEGHSVCASEEFQVAPEMDTDIQDLAEDLDLATQEDPFVPETKDKDV